MSVGILTARAHSAVWIRKNARKKRIVIMVDNDLDIVPENGGGGGKWKVRVRKW